MVKKTTPEHQFFMRIINPNTFRRNLLGASGLTLKILKQTYRVNQVREIKYVLMNKIKKEIRELKALVYRTNELVPSYTKEELKRMFPKVSIPSKAMRGRKFFSNTL